jgi:sortase B
MSDNNFDKTPYEDTDMERTVPGDKKKKGKKNPWPMRIIVIILVAIMCFSAYKVVSILLEYRRGRAAYSEIAKKAGTKVEKNVAGKNGEKDEHLSVDWEALQIDRYPIKGWIYLKGTNINYPVIQGSDNSYYLRRLYTGEYSYNGSIFIDAGHKNPFKEFNTVIYGHRMYDNSMFNLLGFYISKPDYFDSHRTFEIYTPEKNYYMDVFGALSVIATDDEIYRTNWDYASDEEKQHLLNRIFLNNELLGYDDSVNVGINDMMVMLSTCTYDPGDDRIVVFGKLRDMKD